MNYWPKRQPLHFRAPHHSFLGVRQAAGLSRGIFLGAGKHTVSTDPAPRAQKGYPAHIPHALRLVHCTDKSGDSSLPARQ